MSTLNHNLAWNIAQQLFTELQKRNNNLTDLHTISHILQCLILVVLLKEMCYEV